MRRSLLPVLFAVGLTVTCRSTDELSGTKTLLFGSPDSYDLEFEGVAAVAGLLHRTRRHLFHALLTVDGELLDLDEGRLDGLAEGGS